jgi:hypothetical protein
MIGTDAVWLDCERGARAAAVFNALIDRHAGEVPAGAISSYRAALDASPEPARLEFLVGVGGHLCLFLDKRGSDPVGGAAALLAEWFLRPRPEDEVADRSGQCRASPRPLGDQAPVIGASEPNGALRRRKLWRRERSCRKNCRRSRTLLIVDTATISPA